MTCQQRDIVRCLSFLNLEWAGLPPPGPGPGHCAWVSQELLLLSQIS